MTFEEMLKQLNGRGILIHNLYQIEDGKRWSVSLRKIKTTKTGYATDKTIEKAVKSALKNMKDSFSPKEWKNVILNPSEPKKKKRVRLQPRKRK